MKGRDVRWIYGERGGRRVRGSTRKARLWGVDDGIDVFAKRVEALAMDSTGID